MPGNILESLMSQDPLQTMDSGAMDARMGSAGQMPSVQPPRARRSFLDTIGQISDVFAKVGGADALYQPSLDARDDRARMIDIEGMKKQQMQQQIQAGGMNIEDAQHARIGAAMKGLQAIRARGGDVNAAWPTLAQRAGLPDADAAQLGQVFAHDPNQIDGIASMFGTDKEFGLQPFYAQDTQGNLQAYQIGKDGSIQAVVLPEGQSPIDPIRFVDTGGAQVGYGTRSGQTRRVLPNSVDPNTRENIRSRERINRENIRSRERIAAEKGGKGIATDPASALSSIAELRGIYGDLHKMGAMVDPTQSTGTNVAARVRASGIGQMVEGAVGTEAQTKRDRVNSIRPGLMQGLAKATGMTGKQLDSNADVKLFMQTVTDPTASYEANMAALDGLERFVRQNAKKPDMAASPSPRAAPRNTPQRIKPRGRAGATPSVSNW